jgi:hypothetical protein
MTTQGMIYTFLLMVPWMGSLGFSRMDLIQLMISWRNIFEGDAVASDIMEGHN